MFIRLKRLTHTSLLPQIGCVQHILPKHNFHILSNLDVPYDRFGIESNFIKRTSRRVYKSHLVCNWDSSAKAIQKELRVLVSKMPITPYILTCSSEGWNAIYRCEVDIHIKHHSEIFNSFLTNFIINGSSHAILSLTFSGSRLFFNSSISPLKNRVHGCD